MINVTKRLLNVAKYLVILTEHLIEIISLKLSYYYLGLIIIIITKLSFQYILRSN